MLWVKSYEHHKDRLVRFKAFWPVRLFGQLGVCHKYDVILYDYVIPDYSEYYYLECDI